MRSAALLGAPFKPSKMSDKNSAAAIDLNSQSTTTVFWRVAEPSTSRGREGTLRANVLPHITVFVMTRALMDDVFDESGRAE